MKPKLAITGPDGAEMHLPAKFAVCDRCDGTGVHDHPAFSNGISQGEFDDDPDFKESYFKGEFDVVCQECKGERVVAVPDEDKLTSEQKEALEAHWQALSEARAERRMRERGIEF